MLRFAELALTFAPVLAVALLYAVFIRRRRPSARLMTLAVLMVVGLATWLIWAGTSEDLSRQEHYSPAVLKGGEIVQGHGTPP